MYMCKYISICACFQIGGQLSLIVEVSHEYNHFDDAVFACPLWL